MAVLKSDCVILCQLAVSVKFPNLNLRTCLGVKVQACLVSEPDFDLNVPFKTDDFELCDCLAAYALDNPVQFSPG